MLLTASAVVDFASITLLVLAPIAIVQKQKLNELGTLRAQQNELRQVRVLCHSFVTTLDPLYHRQLFDGPIPTTFFCL